jgi:MFS family permease
MKKNQAERADSLVPSRRRLPLAIWTLGFGSLLMDTSSELVHSLSPVLLVNMLGASVVAVGMIEGVAEGTAAVTKVFAGAVSDYFRRRKTLIVLGYALGALAKPLFPLAHFRLVDFRRAFHRSHE